MSSHVSEMTLPYRAATLALCIAAAGCAKTPKLQQPVGETTVSAGRIARAANRPVAPGPTSQFSLTEQTPGPCGMQRLPSVEFEFGSSQLTPMADMALSRLATCLKEAPFAESRVILVGRADPIGSPTYNLELAFERASRVRQKLMELGVEHARMLVTSAGESPLPKDRWDEARRVDLVLARPNAASPPSQE